MALILSALSLMNFLLWLLQTVFYGRRIARTEIRQPPVFVLGHWRSGTTLLHELLVCDPRHTYPNTFDCFCPNHFLLSTRLFTWWLWPLMPAKRPMDDMAVGWDSPQEDEWAMCNMGVRSPYLTLLFPNRPPAYPEYLDLRAISPAARERWKAGLMWFLRCLTLRKPGRIVLKTPQHTCRDQDAAWRCFPTPASSTSSATRTSSSPRRSSSGSGCTVSRVAGAAFCGPGGARLRHLQPDVRGVRGGPPRTCPPASSARSATRSWSRTRWGRCGGCTSELGLGDFEVVRPAIQGYVERTKDYKTNRHELPAEIRDEITRRWAAFIRRYGYARRRRS